MCNILKCSRNNKMKYEVSFKVLESSSNKIVIKMTWITYLPWSWLIIHYVCLRPTMLNHSTSINIYKMNTTHTYSIIYSKMHFYENVRTFIQSAPLGFENSLLKPSLLGATFSRSKGEETKSTMILLLLSWI